MSSQKEPLPETIESVEVSNDLTFEDNQKEIQRLQTQVIQIQKTINNLLKEQGKAFNKMKKSVKRRKKNKNSDIKRKPSGFETPVIIPELFLEFIRNGIENNKFSEKKILELNELELATSSLIPRSLITGTVYDYIKTQGLYMEQQDITELTEKYPELKDHFKNTTNLEKNKRYPQIDDAIRKLFTLQDNEILTFYNFQKYITRLFPKNVKNELITQETEDIEIESDENVSEELETVTQTQQI
jgi:hypothetical protein